MPLSEEQQRQVAALLGADVDEPQAALSPKQKLQTAKQIFEEGSEQRYEDTGAPDDILAIIKQTRAEAKARTADIQPAGAEAPTEKEQKIAELLLTGEEFNHKIDTVGAKADKLTEVHDYFNQVAGSPPGTVPRAIPAMNPDLPDVPNLEYLDKVLPADKPGESVAKAVEQTFWDRTTDYISETYNRIRFDDTGSVTRKAISLMRPRQATPEYDSEGNLLGVRMETDEEARNNHKIAMEAMSRANHADEVSGAAAVTAVMANALLDPVAIMTGRIGLSAQGIGKLASVSAVAGSYTASEEALEQIRAEGGVTDVQDVAIAGATGAAGAAVLGGAFALGGKIAKKYGKARAEKKVDELEFRISQYRNDGLNPGESMARAVDDMGLVEKLPKVIEKAGRKPKIKGPSATPSSDLRTPALFREDGTMSQVAEGVDKFLGSISTRMKNISPSVAASMRRFEFDNVQLAQRDSQFADDFLLAASKLPKKTKQELHKHLVNRDRDAAIELAVSAKNFELKGGLQKVFQLLDEKHTLLREAGVDVNKLPRFFPRVVRDYKSLKKDLGGVAGNQLDDAINRAKQAKLAKGLSPRLTDVEEQNIINNIIKKVSSPVTRTGGRFEKERSLEVVPEQLLKHYNDPATALAQYLTSANHQIAKARLLGGSSAQKAAEESGDAIAAFVQRAKANGEITTGEALELASLITSRLRGGEQAPNRLVSAYKNIFYAGAIGNPLSAIVQLGDVAVAAASQGIMNTLKAVVPGIGSKFTAKQLGVQQIAQELASIGGTAKFLNGMLKVSGFRAIDTFGKRTFLSAAMNRARTQSRSTAGQVKWMKENGWMFRTEQEAQETLRDLANNNITDNVKLFLFNQLSDVQPISLLEVPQKYLDARNGRIFYALKTFMLKQLDIQRSQGLNKIRQGKVAEGVGFLAKYYGLMALGGAGTAQIQNLLLGREEEFTDGMAATLMKNFALSEYNLKDLSKGRVSEFLANIAGPPTAVLDAVIKDVAEFGRDSEQLPFGRTARFVAPGGLGVAYGWWFGGGAERWAKSQERAKKE